MREDTLDEALEELREARGMLDSACHALQQGRTEEFLEVVARLRKIAADVAKIERACARQPVAAMES